MIGQIGTDRGHAVELIKQAGGNLTTKSLDDDDDEN